MQSETPFSQTKQVMNYCIGEVTWNGDWNTSARYGWQGVHQSLR